MTLIYTENTQFSLYYIEAAHLWGKIKPNAFKKQKKGFYAFAFASHTMNFTLCQFELNQTGTRVFNFSLSHFHLFPAT